MFSDVLTTNYRRSEEEAYTGCDCSAETAVVTQMDIELPETGCLLKEFSTWSSCHNCVHSE